MDLGEKNSGTRVPCKVLEFHLNFFKKLEFQKKIKNKNKNSFYFIVRYNSIVQKSSFNSKLDFLKIEFQNKDISLNNFKYKAFCWIF